MYKIHRSRGKERKEEKRPWCLTDQITNGEATNVVSTNHGNSPLPVIYFYIKDNANELITTFPSTRAENQKRQSEGMKETTLMTQEGQLTVSQGRKQKTNKKLEMQNKSWEKKIHSSLKSLRIKDRDLQPFFWGCICVCVNIHFYSLIFLVPK